MLNISRSSYYAYQIGNSYQKGKQNYEPRRLTALLNIADDMVVGGY